MANPTPVTEIIQDIRLDERGALIMLRNLPVAPKGGYFLLPLAHTNYKSLFSLLLMAFANHSNVTLRVSNPGLDPAKDESGNHVEWLSVSNPV